MKKELLALSLARWFLVALVAVVAVQNFRVVRTNRQLRQIIRAQAGLAIAPGDVIPPLIGIGPDGRRIHVDVTASALPTLIFTYSSACPACERSVPAWQRLAAVAASVGVRLVCVSKDAWPDVNTFVARGPALQASLISEPTYATFVSLRLTMVPHTVIAGPSPTVSRVWVGALDDDREAQVTQFLVRLPGSGGL